MLGAIQLPLKCFLRFLKQLRLLDLNYLHENVWKEEAVVGCIPQVLSLIILIFIWLTPVELLEFFLGSNIIEHLYAISDTVNIPKFNQRALALRFAFSSYGLMLKLDIEYVQSLDTEVSL